MRINAEIPDDLGAKLKARLALKRITIKKWLEALARKEVGTK